MFNSYSFVGSKKSVASSMSKGDSQYQKLLDGLSSKELEILQKNPDLITRVLEVTKMTEVQVLAELREEYDLEVDSFQTGEYWIGTEKVEDAIPDWFKSSHCGWFLNDTDAGGLVEWAKSFLMQAVRANLWMRYLEHKESLGNSPHFGMYV